MNTFNVILSGVAVFLIGEVIVRFFLGPLHRFKEVKGEIASTLLFHANNYGQPYKRLCEIRRYPNTDERAYNEQIESAKMWNDDLSKASDQTREMAAKLIAVAEGIPLYSGLAICKVVPPKESILKAKTSLIRLSNSFGANQEPGIADESKEIYALLRIQFVED